MSDIFLGGSAGIPGQLLLQTPDGKFISSNSSPWAAYKASEDLDVLFFDADGDKDLDIYTVSGSNEFPEGSSLYADHLYLNNGKGIFSDVSNKIPALHFSKSVAKASDIDGDGDLDLFVGGRLVPGKYGLSERSCILINNRGNFEDKTTTYFPDMSKAFDCITGACWIDIDNDKDEDLVTVGEWAAIRFFKNEKSF